MTREKYIGDFKQWYLDVFLNCKDGENKIDNVRLYEIWPDYYNEGGTDVCRWAEDLEAALCTLPEGDYEGVSALVGTDEIFKNFAGLDYTIEEKAVKFTAEELANGFAIALIHNGILYVPDERTSFENEEFEKTILGSFMKKLGGIYGEDSSQTSNATAASAANQAASQTATQTAPAATAKPVGGSKLNRGMSKAANLIANDKTYLTNPVTVTGKFTQTKATAPTTTPTLYIKPTNFKQAADTPFVVLCATGNGVEDCKLFFANSAAASDFVNKFTTAKGIPANVDHLSLKYAAVDNNGYLEVETEFGTAYIQAKRLGECLGESFEEEEKELEPYLSFEEAYDYVQGF